jgi:hypothetical protein
MSALKGLLLGLDFGAPHQPTIWHVQTLQSRPDRCCQARVPRATEERNDSSDPNENSKTLWCRTKRTRITYSTRIVLLARSVQTAVPSSPFPGLTRSMRLSANNVENRSRSIIPCNSFGIEPHRYCRAAWHTSRTRFRRHSLARQVLLRWFSYRNANMERPIIGGRRPPSPLGDIQPDYWLAEYTIE